MAMTSTRKPYGWPARETTGVDRSIGVNGTHRSTGEQSPYSNGYMRKGDLGTTPPSGNTNTNRTGEGCG